MIAIVMSAAALIAAQPSTTTPCELEGVSAVDLVALRVAILDQAMHGTPRPATAETTMKAIETKAITCHAGDDPAAGQSAAGIAAARLAADTVAEKLAADGVDMARVATEMKKTDRAVLEALVARKPDAPGVEELRERVVGVAGTDPADDTRRLLGVYAVNAARVEVSVPVVVSVRDTPPVSKPKPKSTTPVER